MHRRIYNRFKVNTLATLTIDKGLEETFILKDISVRGAGIIGNYPLKTNDKVILITQIPFLYDRPIHKEARIVWTKKVNARSWEGGLDFGVDNKLDFTFH